MASLYVRRKKLWMKVKDGSGKWIAKSTPYRVGDEAQALRYAKTAQEVLDARKNAGSAAENVKGYALRWVKERRDRGMQCAKGEEGRLKKHALPLIGMLRLDEVRPRHVRDMVRSLRTGTLAPRSIRNIYGIVHAMLRDAVCDELIQANPCVLKRGELPPMEDKNPEWRATAVFTKPELEKLISDERIPLDRRVLYALEGLAGLRHGEAAGLRWRHLDITAQPLGKLTVATSYDKGRTKTGRTRFVPVHPTLAAMLAEWRLEGWAKAQGRTPDENDIVVPLDPNEWQQWGGRPNPRAGGMRNKSDSWKRFKGDLALLGLRHRRGHDLRRTMISLARMDGARADLLQVCTHNPGRGQGTIDLYTSYDWAHLCAEIAKLKVTRTARGQVVEFAPRHLTLTAE